MAKPRRGELWSANFEPRTHPSEPGKSNLPALVIQTDLLNTAGHPTTIVIPGTTNIQTQSPDDNYPLRVRVQKQGKLKADTELMIDQVRAISNIRLLEKLCVLSTAHMQKINTALRQLTA